MVFAFVLGFWIGIVVEYTHQWARLEARERKRIREFDLTFPNDLGETVSTNGSSTT